MKDQTASFDPSALEPGSEINRRRHNRYPCEARAEVFLPHGGMLLRGRILDLSLSGCFVEAAAITLERGTRVEVHFTAQQLQFRVAGNIAVLHPRRGAGIAFLDLSPRSARQVTDPIRELEGVDGTGRQRLIRFFCYVLGNIRSDRIDPFQGIRNKRLAG